MLSDWGRLQRVGPAASIEGYNGIGMTVDMMAQAETALLTAYKLAIMQTLLPVAYNLHVVAAQTGTSAPDVPTQAQMSFASFGTGSRLFTRTENSSRAAPSWSATVARWPSSVIHSSPAAASKYARRSMAGG